MYSVESVGDHFKKWLPFIVIIFSSVTILGNLYDLLIIRVEKNPISFIFSVVNISLSLSVLLGFLIFKLNPKICLGIIIYSTFLNLLSHNIVSVEFSESYFMRDLIYVGMLILAGGIYLGKNHLIILGVFYSLYYFISLSITKSAFLIENSITLLVSGGFFIGVLYYVFQTLEKNYKYQKELILNLNDQNQKLNEQHAALAELNDTKDRYYSILAHDLRNPMHTILGLSEVVNENLKAGNSEEAALHISTLIGTAQNTYQLLDNLLLWSYSQSGKIKLQSEPFDFKLIIEDSISIFENNIQSKKIKVEFDSNEIHEINADKNMLGTVVRNLLSNAIKFSHRGGKIKISCECKKNQHLFKIKDSGIGIPEDSIQTIFDITNTLSTKGTNNEKGTGYGLAICREFIEKHNGKIWVECKYGRSTTFFFTIPNTAKPLKNYAVD